MTDSTLRTLALQLTDEIREQIPLAAAMHIELADYDGQRLSFALPLAPNINDKGCAFGGSLASVLTLAGWGLVVLALRQRSNEAFDVFVGESTIRYLSPVWADFHAEARLADDETGWEAFFDMLKTRGKARIDLHCEVPGADGSPLATLKARFVAKRHQEISLPAR